MKKTRYVNSKTGKIFRSLGAVAKSLNTDEHVYLRWEEFHPDLKDNGLTDHGWVRLGYRAFEKKSETQFSYSRFPFTEM